MLKARGRTPPFRDASGRPAPASVAECGRIDLGGLDQWVMIRGRDSANPLLVVLHGGPGGSETALFRAYQAGLEDHFTVVYWDQRGAGRSYAATIPPETMTIERFLADLDELVDALRARFGPRKVVLLGHSWGSVLGVLYATRHPDKVAAYVGVGQVSDMAASEDASYAYVVAEAERRGNRKAIAAMEAIGPPPHEMKALAQQRRWLTALGGALGPGGSLMRMTVHALRTPEASVWDIVRLVRGSIFSTKAMWSQLTPINLIRDAARFEVPVVLLLGRHDMQVAAPVSAAYFEAISAPAKTLVWMERSGHMPPFEEPEAFARTMIDTVRPLAAGA